MPGLIKSTLILAFARITNFALLLFSPILLVRIFEPTEFGQYREFVAYATMAAMIAGFSISTNLLYFIPKHPDNTRRYVGNTAWLNMAAASIACAALWLFGDVIRNNTSFDFLLPLSLYVFLYVNVTYLEPYWIATKQPKYVFYYSTLRTIVRLSAVVVTAWQTRSVDAVLAVLIVVELLRIAVVLIVSIRSRFLSLSIDQSALRQQLGFVVPLGLAASIHCVHQYVGQIVISTQLGVLSLAIYAVASYKVPIVRIARGAVSDAIFPDMVRQAASDKGDRLRLWKRGNIAYSSIIIPAFVLLFWYADVLIPLAFTDKYVAAVPIFRILLLLLPLEAIELNSPLRAANRTRDLLAGNLLMLGCNLACIYVVFRFYPESAILGPAVGMVAGYSVARIYMGWRILRFYEIPLSRLLKWRSQMVILLCAGACVLLLTAGEYLPVPEVARILSFSALYLACYVALLRSFGLEEVETVISKIRGKTDRTKRQRGYLPSTASDRTDDS